MMLLVNDDGDIDEYYADVDEDDPDDHNDHPDDFDDHSGDVDDHDADEDEDCKVGRWTPFQGWPLAAPTR